MTSCCASTRDRPRRQDRDHRHRRPVSQTLQTWRAFEDHFGVEIEVFDASSPGVPWSGPEHCCSLAKVDALERSLDGAQAWITGIRREQGPTRAATELIERDEKRGLWKYNPLAHWTDKDLWRRIHERNLPYNPLHDQGYESIGCAPAPSPGSGREGRWAGDRQDRVRDPRRDRRA